MEEIILSQEDDILCSNSVDIWGDVVRWTSSPSKQKFLTEAKRRGLTCGVGSESSNANLASAYQNISDKTLCELAVKDGVLRQGEHIHLFIEEAKLRGLNCVEKTSITDLNERLRKDTMRFESFRKITITIGDQISNKALAYIQYQRGNWIKSDGKIDFFGDLCDVSTAINIKNSTEVLMLTVLLDIK